MAISPAPSAAIRNQICRDGSSNTRIRRVTPMSPST